MSVFMQFILRLQVAGFHGAERAAAFGDLFELDQRRFFHEFGDLVDDEGALIGILSRRRGLNLFGGFSSTGWRSRSTRCWAASCRDNKPFPEPFPEVRNDTLCPLEE